MILSWQFLDDMLVLLWTFICVIGVLTVFLNTIQTNLLNGEIIGRIITILFLTASISRVAVAYAIHTWLYALPFLYVGTVVVISRLTGQYLWSDAFMYTFFIALMMIPARAVWACIKPIAPNQPHKKMM